MEGTVLKDVSLHTGGKGEGKENFIQKIGNVLIMTFPEMFIYKSVFPALLQEAGFDADKYISGRDSAMDAFKSATSIVDRESHAGEVPMTDERGNIVYNGGQQVMVRKVFNLLMRDNSKSALDKSDEEYFVTRELVKEYVDKKNTYVHIAYFKFFPNKNGKQGLLEVDLNQANLDSVVNYQALIQRVTDYYTVYRKCLSTPNIKTVVRNILEDLDASKLAGEVEEGVYEEFHANQFFLPEYNSQLILNLKTLLAKLNENSLTINKILEDEANLKGKSYVQSSSHDYTKRRKIVNSFLEVTSTTEIDLFENAFYSSVLKDIEFMNSNLQNFLKDKNPSEKLIAKFVEKLEKLYAKKKKYQDLFSSSLNAVNQQFFEIQKTLDNVLSKAQSTNNGANKSDNGQLKMSV